MTGFVRSSKISSREFAPSGDFSRGILKARSLFRRAGNGSRNTGAFGGLPVKGFGNIDQRQQFVPVVPTIARAYPVWSCGQVCCRQTGARNATGIVSIRRKRTRISRRFMIACRSKASGRRVAFLLVWRCRCRSHGAEMAADPLVGPGSAPGFRRASSGENELSFHRLRSFFRLLRLFLPNHIPIFPGRAQRDPGPTFSSSIQKTLSLRRGSRSARLRRNHRECRTRGPSSPGSSLRSARFSTRGASA